VKQDLETRARLLKAGEQLFAARSFKDVTVREICRAADANVAAINYHFGDKAGLYRDVLHVAIAAIRDTHEAARRAGAGRAPEEKLRQYLIVLLERALSPGFDTVHRLMQRELDQPTTAIDEIVEQAARPRLEYLAGVVAEMMGGDPKDPAVLRCVGSILSQTVPYARKNPIIERLGFGFAPTRANIEAAADHITTFSIGGIRKTMKARVTVASRARGREA
jgi:AcrR family transcriptional regulator